MGQKLPALTPAAMVRALQKAGFRVVRPPSNIPANIL